MDKSISKMSTLDLCIEYVKYIIQAYEDGVYISIFEEWRVKLHDELAKRYNANLAWLSNSELLDKLIFDNIPDKELNLNEIKKYSIKIGKLLYHRLNEIYNK